MFLRISSKDNIGRFYHYLAAYYHMTERYDQAIKYTKLALYNKPYVINIKDFSESKFK